MFSALVLILAIQASPSDLAHRFCRAMTDDRPLAFATLAESRLNLASRSWHSARDLVVYDFDCIEISSYQSSIDPASGRIVVDIDGSGITRNAKRERRAIPRRCAQRC